MVADGDHGSDEAAHDDLVRLSEPDARAVGVIIDVAEAAPLSNSLALPAEIRFDPDRIADVAAPVGGIVRRLDATEGDMVAVGDVLAVLSSRELADLKAEFLTAQASENLLQLELERAEELHSRNTVSEAQVQTARAKLATAAAAREAAETKLHAVGIDHDVIDSLQTAEDGAQSLFPLTAPMSGQVVRRSATLGARIEEDGSAPAEPMFVIADSSVIWVDVAVFKTDLARISLGAHVVLSDGAGDTAAEGELSFISPIIDEVSRTATARVVVDNSDGHLRPGQFLTAHISVGEKSPVVRVPEAAVQTVEGRTAVFVPVEHGFAPQSVEVGRATDGFVEIVAGLEIGDRYVAEGAFTLKAELEKSAFGVGHAH